MSKLILLLVSLLLVGTFCVSCAPVSSLKDDPAYYFPNFADAALEVVYHELQYVRYDAPNYCYFVDRWAGVNQGSLNPTKVTSNIETLTELPPTPDTWYQWYLGNNSGPNPTWKAPPLRKFQTATMQVAAFQVQFNDTVYLHGKPINSPFYWNPDAGLTETSFNDESIGCKLDTVRDTGNSANAARYIATNPADPFSYATLYNKGIKTRPTAVQFKDANQYCPRLDPFRRYPIWRDRNWSAFGAWEFEFMSPNGKFPNHMSPRKDINSGSRMPQPPNIDKTCGLPYYAFILPWSPTVPIETMLILAQQMLPMPDDISDNKFSIIHWMASYSFGKANSLIPDFTYTRTSPSVFEMSTTKLRFKLPNQQDYYDSCANSESNDFLDNQIVVSMTGLVNDTHKYVDGADYAPPDIQAEGNGKLDGEKSWPNREDCNVRRNGDFDLIYDYDYGAYRKYLKDGHSCWKTSAWNNKVEWDSVTTFGWCINPDEVAPASKQYALTDVYGNPLQLQVTFTSSSSQPCSPDDMFELKEQAKYIIYNFSNAQELSDAVLFQATVNTLHTRYGLSACFDYLKSLYTLKQEVSEVPVPTGNKCNVNPVLQPDQFTADPCCNPSEAFSKCCDNYATGTVTQLTYEIDQFNPALTAKCGNQSLAEIALLEFKAKSEALLQAPAPVAVNDLIDEFLHVRTDCFQKIHNASCTADADCFSKECDLYNQVCTIPYNSLQKITIDCLVHNTEGSTKATLISRLGLSQGATEDELKAAFIDRVTDEDCTGPTSEQFRSKWVYDTDKGVSYVEPGNKDACIAETGCSFKSDDGHCFDNIEYNKDHFCGVCHGQTCWEISQQPKCIVTALTERIPCQTAGFYWLPGVSDEFFTDVDGECLNLAATTEAECLPRPVCPLGSKFRPGDARYRCQGNLCFTKEKRNPTDCKTAEGTWAWSWGGDDGGLCTTYQDPEFVSDNTRNHGCKSGYIVHWGFKWIPGKFETEEKCKVGQCSLKQDWRFVGQDTDSFNATTCGKYSQCTQGCPRCVGEREIPQDPTRGIVCYNPNIAVPNSDTSRGKFEAQKKCAQPQNYVINGQTRTEIGEHLKVSLLTRNTRKTYEVCAYRLSPQECTSAGLTLVSCSSQNRAECANQVVTTGSRDEVLRLSLGCSWDSQATCNTKDQCESTGRCDDDEFVNDDAWVNGRASTGGCKIKAPFVVKSTRYSECSNIRSRYYNWWALVFGRFGDRKTIQFQRKTRNPGWCLDVTFTKQQCIQQGYEWDDRAESRAECEAHGTYCKDLASGSPSGRTGANCTNCGGTQVFSYTWHPGVWYTGFMRDTEWKERKLAPINQWERTINFTKLDSLLSSVGVGRVAPEIIQQQQNQDLMSMINLLSSVVCDCTDGRTIPALPNPTAINGSKVAPGRTSEACYSASNTHDLAPAIVAEVYHLHPSTWQTPGARYVFDASSGGSNFTVINVPLATSAASGGVTGSPAPAAARRRLLQDGTIGMNNYGIKVVDSNGDHVGMQVGYGQFILVNVVPGSMTTFFNVEGVLVNQIDRSIYYLPAIAKKASNGRIEIIAGMPAIMENNEAIIKTNGIYETGEYYPVFLKGTPRVVPAEFLPPPPKPSAANNNVVVTSLLSMISIILSLLLVKLY